MKLRYAVALAALAAPLVLGMVRAAEPGAGEIGAFRKAELAAAQNRISQLEKQLARLQQQLDALRSGKDAPTVNTDDTVTQVVSLQTVRAEMMAESLMPLIAGNPAKGSRIVADARTNSLIIQAPAKQVEAIVKIVALAENTASERPSGKIR